MSYRFIMYSFTMTSPTQYVAANLRAELARRGIPQRVVAEKLGIAQQLVSNRLKGKTPISLDELARIAELLEMPVRDLVVIPEVAS